MKNLIERMDVFTNAVDIYPVVTSDYCAGRDPLEVIRAIGEGGAKIFQLREKHCSDAQLLELARKARTIADEFQMLFILDDRLDVGILAGADGVHLGQDDIPTAEAKKLAPEMIIGSSTHNLEEALEACRAGADYLNIGPVFPTQTKNVAYDTVGIDSIPAISQHINIPFTVMGGIKARHIPELRQAGAKRIAMVTEITQAEDICQKVRELRELFR